MTGASKRNWASYGADVELPPGLPDWRRDLLADPQTSGGLLVAVASDAAEAVLQMVRDAGHPDARIVGRAQAGEPGIKVVERLEQSQ